jgi:hypothetical protein
MLAFLRESNVLLHVCLHSPAGKEYREKQRFRKETVRSSPGVKCASSRLLSFTCKKEQRKQLNSEKKPLALGGVKYTSSRLPSFACSKEHREQLFALLWESNVLLHVCLHPPAKKHRELLYLENKCSLFSKSQK